jgi:hypothetical protein
VLFCVCRSCSFLGTHNAFGTVVESEPYAITDLEIPLTLKTRGGSGNYYSFKLQVIVT